MKIAANGLSLILTQKRISTSILLTLLLFPPTFQHRKYLFELVKLPGNIEACRRTRMFNSYHSCYVTLRLSFLTADFRRGQLISYISVAILLPPSGLFIPQLSRPYPKKRDYLCHDTVRAMPVRYKTPLAPRAPLYK